jgi:cation transport regulator
MAFGRLAKLLQGDITERRPRPLDERSTMPYKQITQLPVSVKNNLPKGAQEIYKEAFNSAEEQYGEEDRAHRVAWSAVENKYEKNEKGNWVKKNS